MTQELRARKLRREIHALRVRKFHWQLDSFKFIIKGLGYGDSLRALPEVKLLELKALLLSYRKHGRPQSFTYDKQGRFMFALMKQANWTDSELRAFMLKHYHKSHWNLLCKPERRAVIAMLENYINKVQHPSDRSEDKDHSSKTDKSTQDKQ